MFQPTFQIIFMQIPLVQIMFFIMDIAHLFSSFIPSFKAFRNVQIFIIIFKFRLFLLIWLAVCSGCNFSIFPYLIYCNLFPRYHIQTLHQLLCNGIDKFASCFFCLESFVNALIILPAFCAFID